MVWYSGFPFSSLFTLFVDFCVVTPISPVRINAYQLLIFSPLHCSLPRRLDIVIFFFFVSGVRDERKIFSFNDLFLLSKLLVQYSKNDDRIVELNIRSCWCTVWD